MVFITFFYRLHYETFFGKYVGDISDDHEGLDLEMKHLVLKTINQVRIRNNKEPWLDIHLGILSISTPCVIPTFSSTYEKCSFDFYYDNEIIYLNGQIQETI